MSANSNNLDELRGEIDVIDEALHDLIMRRADVVTCIKEIKQDGGGPIFWPGREAEVLRRLMERHHGDFPRAVIAQIWRELISAFVAMQGEFKIAVWVGDDTAYLDIARDHFGSQTLLTSHATSCSVLQAVAKGTASAGILPLPQIDEGTWWPLLGSENNGRQVRICARLPFVSGENRRGGCVEALLVADLVPVETGDDGSYLIIECSSPISRPHLTELLTSAGFALTALVSLPNTMDIASREIFLIEVAGFVDIDDRRLGQLLDDNPVFTVVRAVGSYAMPLNTET